MRLFQGRLLRKGKTAYINQDPNITRFLGSSYVVPVQRNKGIDGFLKIRKMVKPIPVRVQKEHESLEDAIKLLLQACKKNGYQKKILIKTNDLQDATLFNYSIEMYDKNLIVIDNFDKFYKESENFIANIEN